MDQISILMSTYREPISYLEQAVESILRQTYQSIQFVIMVDDVSNEPIVQRLMQYQQEDPRICLVMNEKNLGLVASLNKGLAYCTGQYIARMDADDISLPQRLETQLNYLKQHNLDFVACGYQLFSNEADKEVVIFPESEAKCKKLLRQMNCMPHPTWLARREVFWGCQGYRDVRYCEDYDFVIRATEAGFKIANVPQCLFKYRYHEQSISRRKIAEQTAVAAFLAEQVRKSRPLSMGKYEAYLKSEHFKKRRERHTRLQKQFSKVKNAGNLFEKMLYTIVIAMNPYFWSIKIKRLFR